MMNPSLRGSQKATFSASHMSPNKSKSSQPANPFQKKEYVDFDPLPEENLIEDDFDEDTRQTPAKAGGIKKGMMMSSSKPTGFGGRSSSPMQGSSATHPLNKPNQASQFVVDEGLQSRIAGGRASVPGIESNLFSSNKNHQGYNSSNV